MSKDKTILNQKAGTSTLVRAKFAPGMLLQHDDLEAINNYTRDLSRLLFRSFFGCGVVCGLEVKPDKYCGQDAITVYRGVALTCLGDPLYVPAPITVTLEKDCSAKPPTDICVVLCATRKCCSPRVSNCDSGEESTTSQSREIDGFEVRIMSECPKCACGCSTTPDTTEDGTPYDATGAPVSGATSVDCNSKHNRGDCGCGCSDCSDAECSDCVILAHLTRTDATTPWNDTDYTVRRFIRPALLADPRKPPVTQKSAPVQPTTQTVQQAGVALQQSGRALRDAASALYATGQVLQQTIRVAPDEGSDAPEGAADESGEGYAEAPAAPSAEASTKSKATLKEEKTRGEKTNDEKKKD